MKNTLILKHINLGILLSFSISIAAQQTVVVVNTQTDKRYANTTEIYKSDKASDTQVLKEIEGNFGLGDVVRIAVAPPKPAPQAPIAEAKKPVALGSKNKDLAIVTTPSTRSNTVMVQTQTLPVPQQKLETKAVSAPIVQKTTVLMVENKEPIAVMDNKLPELETVSANDNQAVLKNKENVVDVSHINRESRSVSNRSSAKSSNSVKRTKVSKSRNTPSFAFFKSVSLPFFKHSAQYKGSKKWGCYRF